MFENRRHKCKDGDIIGPDSDFEIKSTSFILLWLRRSTGGPHSLMPDVFDKLMCEVVYELHLCAHAKTPTLSEVMEGVRGVFFLHGFEIP